MEGILNFIQDNWEIILVLTLMILSVLRLIISNPKYSLKEIAKNPLLIFKLLATATQETIEMIDQSSEALEDVLEEINESVDEIEKTKQEMNKTKEKIENTIKRKQEKDEE